MDKIDRLLNELEAEAGNFSSFEAEDFSNFSPKQAARLAAVKNAQSGRYVPQQKAGLSGAAGLKINPMKGNPQKIAAQLDIKVKLTNGATSGVAGKGYEFAIFGANDLETGYNGIITDTVTLGAAYAVKTGILGQAGARTAGFDGTNIQTGAAAATDGIINISSDVVDYPVLLKALITDMFHVNRIRVSVADTSANGLLSLGEKLKIVTKSIFGRRDEDVISMSSFKMPEQNQAGIIDIPVDFWVDSNVSLVSKIYTINATGGALQQTITFSFFISEYYKHNPKNVGM